MKHETPRKAAFVLGLSAIWLALVQMRASWMDLRCVDTPLSCSIDSLGWIDRLWLRTVWARADELSLWTQDFSGAFLIAVSWTLTRTRLDRRFQWIYTGVVGTLMNGVVTETIRLLVQRPRPFVYLNPTAEASDPAHYTSFVSGHTSFSAMACTMAILVAVREKSGIRLVAPIALILPLATGVLRVLAGRHFPSDVFGGIVSGCIVGASVATWFAPRSRVGSDLQAACERAHFSSSS